jgi:hypothetical protein
MSNYLGVATVTAAIQNLLQGPALQAVPGAVLTTRRPEKVAGNGQDKAGINVFLYQVSSNLALSNMDLPTRNSGGLYTQKPHVALDLYYLLSFQGSDLDFEPQRLLGSAVSILHSQPVLTATEIQAAIQTNPYLSQSDLASQVELVRILPLTLSLEELAKLWSVFFQIPYILSAAYKASVVIIEADVPVTTVKPVLTRNIPVTPGVPGS